MRNGNKEKGKKNLLIPAAAGSSPSMQLLVFWPLAGTWGAGGILAPCAPGVVCYEGLKLKLKTAHLCHPAGARQEL